MIHRRSVYYKRNACNLAMEVFIQYSGMKWVENFFLLEAYGKPMSESSRRFLTFFLLPNEAMIIVASLVPRTMPRTLPLSKYLN